MESIKIEFKDEQDTIKGMYDIEHIRYMVHSLYHTIDNVMFNGKEYSGYSELDELLNILYEMEVSNNG